MHAWQTNGNGGVDFYERPMPAPASNHALIQCKATAIARGEVRNMPNAPAGRVPGLDLAGVVVKSAEDGSGPPQGSRVIAMTGFYGGGWGEFAALPTGILGVIPDALSWSEAAVLPTPGLTALGAIRHGGFLLGKRVLVTGATGNVGRIAGQLAMLSGARVTGTLIETELAASLTSLGFEEAVIANDTHGLFDLVVDTVGGGVLAHAMQVIAPDGVIVTVGGGRGFDTPKDNAIVPHEWSKEAPGARLETENVGVRVMRGIGIANDLQLLGRLAAERKLDVSVEREVDWREIPALLEQLKAGHPQSRVAVLID